MASWVAIANLALRRLGADRITDLDDDDEGARAVSDVYELVRDQVLRAHPWNCALVRKSLAPDDTDPVYGYDYQYTLPSDPYCLRIWRIDGNPEYVIEGRKILTDEGTELKILYISRVTDPEQFDAQLVVAMAAHIAHEIAFRLTNSRTAEDEMKKWAKETLALARSSDAQEGTPEDVEADDFLNSRY